MSALIDNAAATGVPYNTVPGWATPVAAGSTGIDWAGILGGGLTLARGVMDVDISRTQARMAQTQLEAQRLQTQVAQQSTAVKQQSNQQKYMLIGAGLLVVVLVVMVSRGK